MNLLATVVLLTLGISATCSLFEAILYSTRVSSLEAAKAQGRHAVGADLFLGMKRNIAVPTSAILILNTVANTGGAAFIGMLAAQQLGASYVPLFSAFLTVAILLFSEILPKTVGAVHWRSLWPVIVWPLAGTQKILWPLIWLTERFAKLFTPAGTSPATTEDEILAMIQLGAKAGEVTGTELELLTHVFEFDELTVEQSMRPRHEVAWLDAGWDVAQCLSAARQTRHTRYPLCRGSLEEAIGVVNIKDLIGIPEGESVDVASLARPLEKVPETMPAPSLLRLMQSSRQHLALAIDELGSVVGLVTFEDVVERLVGAMEDEFDVDLPELTQQKPGRYVAHGRVPLSRLNRELDLRLAREGVHTLSGLLVSRLGRLPKAGDRIELEGVRAEVLEVTRHRASRVRLSVSDVKEPIAPADTGVEAPTEERSRPSEAAHQEGGDAQKAEEAGDVGDGGEDDRG